MGHIGSIANLRRAAVFVMVYWSTSQAATASPTLVGLDFANPSSEVTVFADSIEGRVVHVTPPRRGTLEINQSNIAVDLNTCEAVKDLFETRRSQQGELLALQKQKATITEFQGKLLLEELSGNLTEAEADERRVRLNQLSTGIETQMDDVALRIDNTDLPDHLLQPAGYYSFVASAPWSEQIALVSAAAAGKTVNAIQTDNVDVFVSVIGAEGFKGTELIAKVNSANIVDLASVVDAVQIDVEPTRVGACFIKFPELMGNQVDEQAFALTLNYTYKINVTTQVTASYNLRDVYSYLEERGTKGGLFSSESWSNVTESRDVDEVFNLDIKFEDDADPEAEAAERARVRSFLLGYAIQDMTSSAIPAGEPGKSGAAIASAELNKVCGVDPYCQGVAVGLKVLDGFFGSSGSRSQLTRVLDVTRTYNSSVSRTISIPGAISFVVE